MPENWKNITMHELCEITSSKRVYASDYQSDGIPFYRSKEIIEKYNGNIDVSTELFISNAKYETFKSKFGAPEEGDLLLTSVGTLGVPYIVKKNEIFYFKDGNLTWFKKFNKLHSQFLYYWLLSPNGKAELKKCTIGSSQSAFTIVLLKDMQIGLPGEALQHTIASILSAYDDLIENNLKQIKILEEMAQMIYREWFVNFRFPGHEKGKMVDSPLGKVPEGWEVKKLGDIAKDVRRSIKPEEVDSKTPYFGLEHLPRKSIALSEWGKAEQITSTKLIFKKREILFGKIRPYFHKVGVAPVEGICSSDTIVISPIKDKWFPLALMCASSVDFVNHATQTSQGTKMPRANWNVLVKYPIITPPDDILEEFNEIVNNIVDKINNLIFKNINLCKTRDMLLPKLISGELDVEGLDIEILKEVN